MTDTYDYRELIRPLIAVLKDKTGAKVYESSFEGRQPKDPFLTYEPITPYIPLSVDVVDDEIWECTWSIDAVADDMIKAMSLAQKALKVLRTQEASLTFEDVGIYLVEEGQAERRDVPYIEGVQKHRVGFDIRIRVQDHFTDDVQTIDSIEQENKEA